jgi:hypothetical protein
MKKILIIFSVVCLGFQACNKDEAATAGFDFSASLPAYVELSSTAAKTVKQGASTTVTFVMRSAFQQAVTVYYDVTGGGVNLTNQTVVIERNKLTAVATINIPAGVIVAPNTTATATLTLTKAVTASGTQLTIGQKNIPAAQKVTINITQ